MASGLHKRATNVRFLGIATAAMSPWSNMRLTGTAAVAMPFR